MDAMLQRHEFGFYEIIQRPSVDELERHYADTYYQDAKGSYESTYSDEELAYFKGKLQQRHALLESIPLCQASCHPH